LSRVELESFIKSFLLFFISLGLLISFLFYINYTKEINNLDNDLFSKMKVCSYNLKCSEFEINFIEKQKQVFYELSKEENTLKAYFPISSANDFIMELRFDKKKYTQLLKTLEREILIEYSVVILVILILSAIFSLFSLHPLRNALVLTQEFIKDILHDFNTPLATLRLNTSMLKKDELNKNKIDRIEQSVQNILDLQENLRAYLNNHELQKEYFDMKELVIQRVELLEKNYSSLEFKVIMDTTHIATNKEAMKRILDNLLTNAAKYNKKDGFVHVSYDVQTESLNIQDSGIGIKNPSRIFERFYKEGERGIGIGLHIVKKLCDELNIDIKVKSELGVGSTFFLTLH